MITTILVLVLFIFLIITVRVVIDTYQFFVKYIQPKIETKRIEREKLIEEYNTKKDNQIIDPLKVGKLQFKNEKEYQDYRNKVFGFETFIGVRVESTNEYGTRSSTPKYFTSNKDFIEWKKEIEKDPSLKIIEFTPSEEQFKDYIANV